MKIFWKVLLIILGIIIIVGTYAGYKIYVNVAGSESLNGTQGEIPKHESEFPPLTTDTADWPVWRGINNDGKSNFLGIKTDWNESLTKVWSVDYLCQDNRTASWSAVVVQGNRLIVPGRDDTSDLLFCLNAETGELIWKGEYEAETYTSHGPGPRATPFIDGGLVYSFGRNGDLACWNLYDGDMLWKTNVRNIGGVQPNWGYSSTPYVFEDKVIVQGGGTATVQAYDKMSGELIWKSMEGPSGFSAMNTIQLKNKTYLLIYHGLGLSCLDPLDGRELWKVPYETDYGVNATTPIVIGNKIFHTSGYKMGAQFIEADVEGYKILWTNKEFAAQHSDPIHIDGYIYGYSGESARPKGDFMCIELSTGEIKWSTKEIGQGTTTFVDGHLICQDLKGNLYFIDPDPKAFNKVSEFKEAIPGVRHLAWTVPVVANGKLYLRYLQHLICYDLI